MEYYYTDGLNNYGPFTLEQLKEKGITPSTKIWYSGLAGWTAASEIPELAPILGIENPAASIPPNANTGPIPTRINLPKSWFVESILVTLFCCQPFGVVGIVYAALVESAIAAGNLAEAERVSKMAGKWVKIAFFCGLAMMIVVGIFYLVVGLMAFNRGSSFQNL